MKNNKKITAYLLLATLSAINFGFVNINTVEAKTSAQDIAKAKQSYTQGLDYFNKNDMKNAANTFMEASKMDSENPLYQLFSADTLRALKQYPSSIRYYNNSLDNLKHAKKNIKDKIKLKAFIGLAMSYSGSNDKVNSVKYANKAINEFPKDYRGHLTLGNIYNDLIKDNTSAIKEYNASIEVNKEQLDSYVKLVKLYNKTGDIDNIIKTYKEAIDYRPLDLSMKMSLAQLYISHKDEKTNADHYSDAIAVLTDLLNVDYKNDFAHYYLGTLYTLQSNNNKAEEELGILNQLNPNLGDRLGKEILAYRKKHANDKANIETQVTVDEVTGQTKITVITNKPKSEFSDSETKEIITLDDNKKNDKEKKDILNKTNLKKEDPLISKQVKKMESQIINESSLSGNHTSSSASKLNKSNIKINNK